MGTTGTPTAVENSAVTNFREYLRVKTLQPNPDYDAACAFLTKWAADLGIAVQRYEPKKGFPFIVMTIPGSDPTLTSLMLYSHVDVVPVCENEWTHDPFSAHKDANGDIFARGAQDMKCLGSQYFEAIRRHFNRGTKMFLRTIHLVYAPDEELAGLNGMKVFVETPEFKSLNVGYVLDEGVASQNDTYIIFYGERSPWWFTATFRGSPGHGAGFITNTAGEKMHSFVTNALVYRDQQKALLEANPRLALGDVTTLNLTMTKGGSQVNVLPDLLECSFDVRLSPKVDFDEFEKVVRGWAETAGPGTTIEFIHKAKLKNVTPTTADCPFWAAFEKTLTDEGCKFVKTICPASTDSRYLREKGYKSIGFSPMNNTRVKLHDHNEYLNEKVFLRGVEIYEKLIANLANVNSH